jgi:hypothetical protein
MSLSEHEKSEIERKRKEHTARILTAKANERDRERWLNDSQFICVPKFQNSLPRVPCGPYFKTIQLTHTFDNFASYTMSSLENSFIWQPHTKIDVGLNIDLVDQDMILASNRSSGVVDKDDVLFLNAISDRKRKVDVLNKRVPWLKRTTYTSNDLNNNINKFTEVVQTKSQDKLQITSLLDKSSVELSFDASRKLTKSSIQTKSKRAVDWVLPLVPDINMWTQALFQVQYTDDTFKLGGVSTSDENNSSSNDGNAAKRHKACTSSIITMRRLEVKKDEEIKNKSSFAASLHSNLSTNLNSDLSTSTDNTAAQRYPLVRDFRVDLEGGKGDDLYALSVHIPYHTSHHDKGDDVETNGYCSFVPLKSRIKVKSHKGVGRSKKGHCLTVVRRENTDAEIKEREDILGQFQV